MSRKRPDRPHAALEKTSLLKRGVGVRMNASYQQLAGMIDHALLKPMLSERQLERGVELAVEYEVACVCVLPYFLKRAGEMVAGTAVIPSTVIGFPHGGQSTSTKLAEAGQALDDGGVELDMVINISKALSGDWAYVHDEIQRIVDAAHAREAKVKVIFENCYLEDDHKKRLCEICAEVDADWVKTSTGFGPSGAIDRDLRLMREHSPPSMQIKAAGGIKTLDRLLEVRDLGCTRAGASATAAILNDARRSL